MRTNIALVLGFCATLAAQEPPLAVMPPAEILALRPSFRAAKEVPKDLRSPFPSAPKVTATPVTKQEEDPAEAAKRAAASAEARIKSLASTLLSGLQGVVWPDNEAGTTGAVVLAGRSYRPGMTLPVGGTPKTAQGQAASAADVSTAEIEKLDRDSATVHLRIMLDGKPRTIRAEVPQRFRPRDLTRGDE